jgi:hypothetical protein
LRRTEELGLELGKVLALEPELELVLELVPD